MPNFVNYAPEPAPLSQAVQQDDWSGLTLDLSYEHQFADPNGFVFLAKSAKEFPDPDDIVSEMSGRPRKVLPIGTEFRMNEPEAIQTFGQDFVNKIKQNYIASKLLASPEQEMQNANPTSVLEKQP